MGNSQDKIIYSIIKIAIVVGLCSIAGTIVRYSTVSDRLERADTAIEALSQNDSTKKVVSIDTPELKIIETSKSFDGVINKELIRYSKVDPKSKITLDTSIDDFTLGKRKYTDITANESIVSEALIPSGETEDIFYSIPKNKYKNNNLIVSIESENNSDKVVLNEVESKLYSGVRFNSDNLYFLIPKNLYGKDIKINTTQILRGSREIDLDVDNTYSLQINTKTDKFSIKGVESEIQKNNGEQQILINVSPENLTSSGGFDSYVDAKIQFLSKTDEIKLVERSIKYIYLVILLVFVSIFFFDLRKGLVFNSLQYLLVGVSLVLFYLFVLGFGEYIGFLPAYILGSVTTIVINGWYTSKILNDKKSGLIISLIIALIYSLIYILLSLNNFNFLLGVVILYFVLLGLMIFSLKMKKIPESIV